MIAVTGAVSSPSFLTFLPVVSKDAPILTSLWVIAALALIQVLTVSDFAMY